MENGSEYETPPDLSLRRDATPDEITAANVGLVLHALATSFVEVTRLARTATGLERRAAKERLGQEARTAADALHDLARLIEDDVRGYPPRTTDLATTNRRRRTMSKWIFKGLMAVSIVGGALVTGGILPAAFGVVAAAVGTAAGLFHDSPGGAK
jgi:hypothetical protein